MKKNISIILAITIAASLSGCGTNESSGSSAPETTANTASATEETTSSETATDPVTEAVTQAATTTDAPVEESTTTEPETENTTEEEAIVETELPRSTDEYAERIGEQLEITDVITMAASMIGAEEGTSFKYNGNKFEIYRFNEGDPKLDEAASGSMTITIEGFGDFESLTSVNGNFVMIYSESDDAVVSAFNSIK